MDDYWIGGHTIEECERHLQNLRLALHEYELALNEFKTKIVPTNVVFGESWPTEFEEEIRGALDRRRVRDADAVAVLSKIVDRARAANDDGMIRHVIRKIDENRLWRSSWPVLEHFLAQSAIQFSHSFDFVARVIVWRLRIEEPVDRTLWKDVTMSLATQASSLGRDSEVLWSLWLLKELGVKVHKALSAVLIKNSCPLVLGYLAHMYSKGLTNDRALANQLWQAVDGDEYAGRHWPLSLELVHLDIANPGAIRSSAHDALQILHRARATLIDWEAVPPVFAGDHGDEPDDDDDPEYAIEDYTSDYDTDEDDAGGGEDEDDDLPDDLPI